MRLGTNYQYALIALGLVSTALFSVFLYREMFPEYLIYQNDYIALENFRSSYSGEPAPELKKGVKQIVIEREDKGPPVIDRCTSCHVALQIEAFSKIVLARDLNGHIIYDKAGVPKKVENPDFIWKKLDEAIAKDPSRKAELEALKYAEVGELTYDVSKVLVMHPLIGKETRPFEFHPIEDYGCVSCHGGNGRGLVTDRAHGPVFDGQYEKESVGFVPEFLEKDPLNDPLFSRVFNAKPGPRLLFQTNPLYVGALIQAKCMQCHQSSQEVLDGAKDTANIVIKQKTSALLAAEKSYDLEKTRVKALLELNASLSKNGIEKTLAAINAKLEDYTHPKEDLEVFQAQKKFFQGKSKGLIQSEINAELKESLGSEKTIAAFEASQDFEKTLAQTSPSAGSLFEKQAYYNYVKELMQHISDLSGNSSIEKDETSIGDIQTDVDLLTKDYQKGKGLFLSQGCYACHRIAGFARGGVGPELTRSGETYPWFLKESIVWPQADLKTSTMPNLRLDHEEVEALVTYLLAQTQKNMSVSDSSRKAAIQEWELGKRLPWEKPVSEKEIHDLKYGMTVFALEGCASCHKLLGYESDVGLAKRVDVEWFKNLFPEIILGSQIVKVIEDHEKEIDQKLLGHVRKGSLVEELESTQPGAIEALYSNFKFALRAKDHEGEKASSEWKARVNKVLKMFVQTYGLGRVICPKLNWSGVTRSDQWLMEHFKAPTSRVPRSIMPVFPFDDSKFQALTYTLDQLARQHVEKETVKRKAEGFNPETAYQEYCSQCHGNYLQGNGAVAEWLYPPPKNLKNSEFLRNLGKERAVQSIMHGVKGTPMPPWGELGEGKSFENNQPVMTEAEIRQLVNWLFASIPGATVIRSEVEVPKWNYEPKDVIQELKDEGAPLSLIFDEIKNTGNDPEENAFYIKQKYYTPQNIEAGNRFFIVNCAPCHGNEADGAGNRAEAMHDAKPRMLVNLDWLESHDDLRLLRSIKYGVSGTSMTPWGDLTSALQRLQLVVFIRSLSTDKVEKRRIEQVLYQTFDAKDATAFKKQKELFNSLGNGFLSLHANEEILNAFIGIIGAYGTENEGAEVKLLQKEIDKQIQSTKEENKVNAWTKQKHLLTSTMAELSRMKKQDTKK